MSLIPCFSSEKGAMVASSGMETFLAVIQFNCRQEEYENMNTPLHWVLHWLVAMTAWSDELGSTLVMAFARLKVWGDETNRSDLPSRCKFLTAVSDYGDT